MTERTNLNMEDLEMVTGGVDRIKYGNDKNDSRKEKVQRS